MAYTIEFDWGHQAVAFGLAVLGSLTASTCTFQHMQDPTYIVQSNEVLG